MFVIWLVPHVAAIATGLAATANLANLLVGQKWKGDFGEWIEPAAPD